VFKADKLPVSVYQTQSGIESSVAVNLHIETTLQFLPLPEQLARDYICLVYHGCRIWMTWRLLLACHEMYCKLKNKIQKLAGKKGEQKRKDKTLPVF